MSTNQRIQPFESNKTGLLLILYAPPPISLLVASFVFLHQNILVLDHAHRWNVYNSIHPSKMVYTPDRLDRFSDDLAAFDLEFMDCRRYSTGLRIAVPLPDGKLRLLLILRTIPCFVWAFGPGSSRVGGLYDSDVLDRAPIYLRDSQTCVEAVRGLDNVH
ncbi:hypothetical protein D9757_004951 [Collybiopsis confluens]|uniref:Uncharacterized protein n=1 Tax=Collybiopsis confluens TaxID=2823264 RepID=A0A8H5HTN4_9AGAR|nr:hypothetical protein D9757_004951 [Collybiopsis confluens]